MEPVVSPNGNHEQAGAVAPEEKKLTSTSELEDSTNYSVAPDLRSRIGKQIDRCFNVVPGKNFIISVISIAFVIIGIIFLTQPRVSISSKEKILDYTDCIKHILTPTNITCKESKQLPCVSFIDFNITEELEGNIAIYYEVDQVQAFDQSRNDYVKSRDDNQLKGELAMIPSENCEPYRYDTVLGERKPIYPCGAIADSMFNDAFNLTYIQYDAIIIVVPFISHGLLTEADKLGYRNPTETIGLQNFTKPKTWTRTIWELDTENPENNGVQNERFIGWMKTELKRKPYARVDQNQTVFAKGLPAGEYRLRLEYNYPPGLSGRRTFIISASVVTSSITFTVIGILFLLFGLILLAKTVAIFVINNYVKAKENERPASGNLTNNR